MAVDPQELRVAMRKWATGVTIVSASYQGVSHGMTVNSFASVSLEPPTVLISMSRDSRTHALVLASGAFAVTFLKSDQQELSELFAGRLPDDEDRFAGLTVHTLTTGSPFLTGGLAFLDCRVIATHAAGTNTLVIGEVVAARSTEEGLPLLYYDRHYREMQD
ncbi:MAG TPA: flavin reductase family protein [Anaerolineales bacterium]|nr:flavin reductase family protein [Anaerolineales bacterium]